MKIQFLTLCLTLTFAVFQGSGHAQPPAPALLDDAHALVFNHTAVQRTIEEIPNGVRTMTTMTDPELVPILRRHVREMTQHLDSGGRVRAWDPLFAELAAVQEQIDVEWKDVEGGLEVISTSANPEVVKLIRAHAAKVSAMAAEGPAAMRQATPLPADYRPAADASGEATPAVCGPGQRPGAGCGAPRGWGQGQGAGVGAGQSCGPGRGAAAGQGQGCGFGRGAGRGPGRGRAARTTEP